MISKPKVEFLKEAEGVCMMLGCKIEGAPAVHISGLTEHGLICKDCVERAGELAGRDKPQEPA